MSFGFECERGNPRLHRAHDERTKITIIHIVKEYFKLNGENALLYICLNAGNMARSRGITFGRWFNESGDGYERYKSGLKTEKLNFYSSLILKKNNPDKEVLINAFYYTIDYWFPKD